MGARHTARARRLAALALSVAAGVAHAGQLTSAPQPNNYDNPIAVILEGPKLWTTPGDPKGWVSATRPPKDKIEFMPVGVTPPDHHVKAKTPGELAAAKADLDATRAALDDLAAHKPTIAPIGPPPPPPVRPQLTGRQP